MSAYHYNTQAPPSLQIAPRQSIPFLPSRAQPLSSSTTVFVAHIIELVSLPHSTSPPSLLCFRPDGVRELQCLVEHCVVSMDRAQIKNRMFRKSFTDCGARVTPSTSVTELALCVSQQSGTHAQLLSSFYTF